MKAFLISVFSLVALAVVSSQALAQEAIVLNPGDEVTVYRVPTIVSCEGSDRAFAHYCKCVVQGFSKDAYLQMVLDKQGNVDVLAIYSTMDKCEEALRSNPGCDQNR